MQNLYRITSYNVCYTKLLRKRILEQKQEFETIFKTSKDGMAITDLKTNFLEFNHAYEEISGYTKEELLKKSSLELSSHEHKNKMKEMIKTARNNFV